MVISLVLYVDSKNQGLSFLISTFIGEQEIIVQFMFILYISNNHLHLFPNLDKVCMKNEYNNTK